MRLTPLEYATAARELEQAGISGTDLTTSLRGVCALVGDIGYYDWLRSLLPLAIDDARRIYGADHLRTVWALRQTAIRGAA